MSQRCETSLLTYEGVTQCAEVSGVAHLFGEDVAGVDGSGDVVNIHFLGLDTVANSAILEVDVAYALGACAF